MANYNHSHCVGRIEKRKWRISALNVNGLKAKYNNRDPIKMKKLSSFVDQYDVCFLSELHLSNNTSNSGLSFLSNVCFPSYTVFPSLSSSRSCGTCILFHSRAVASVGSANIELCEADSEGRYVLVKVSAFTTKPLFFLAVYAPNDSHARANFFESLHSLCRRVVGDNPIIVGGDFNCISDPLRDKVNGNAKGGTLGARELLAWMAELHLVDGWRQSHPDDIDVTWYERSSRKALSRVGCRIDRFLISKDLCGFSTDFTILNDVLISDHFPIQMTVFGGEVERGGGYWKLNVSLLENEAYCDLIENVFLSTACGRSLVSIHDWWETIKKRVKEVSVRFSRELACRKRVERDQRVNDIRCLARLCCWLQSNSVAGERVKRVGRCMKLMHECSFCSELFEIGFGANNMCANITGVQCFLDIAALFRFASDKLEVLRKEEDDFVRHSVFLKDFSERAALEFAVHPSKSFFQQTKEKTGKERLISCLCEDGKERRTTDQIQDVARNFYERLWAKRTVDSVLQEQFLSGLSLSLSAQERSVLDMVVTEDEVCTAIGQLAKEKTPGLDGLPAEFYQKFKLLLSKHLTPLCNSVFHSECTHSQKLAVISLLFKKGSRSDIRNYRPISLLNVDYKICAKVLANRIKLVLNHVIHPDQSGFIPHGDIGENVLLTQAIIDFCEEQEKDGYLIFLDWENAFDRVDHDFMFRVLKRMGFGDFFVGAVRALYTDVSSCLYINQCVSPSFPIHGGVRQGCPLSPYLFILVLECLAVRIRADRRIVGFTEPLSGNISTLSLFADDITVFLSSLDSARALQDVVSEYERATGSLLNKSKTVVLRV
jgi:exonuclease III